MQSHSPAPEPIHVPLPLAPMPDSERSTTPSSSVDRRSVSRGREAFSSGRGGIGNMHRPSGDPASPAQAPEEPISPVRGREATVDPERAKSTGRGGMGNIRSGSRARDASKAVVPEAYPQTASLISDQAANIAEYERYVIEQNEEAARARAVRPLLSHSLVDTILTLWVTQRSSGRGGLGNIKSDSKSRSRSRVPQTPQVLSTGRGGVGNLQPGTNADAELIAQLEEEERVKHAHEGGIHSTGRGGRANLTALPSPPPEPAYAHAHAHEYEATGRGGAGNIRSRSASREQNRSRSASRGPGSRPSSLARMLGKVGLHHTPTTPRDEDEATLAGTGGGGGGAGMSVVTEDEDGELVPPGTRGAGQGERERE
ncbi:hypothetical protein OH77DRAFT_724802 [Trametes cingulata]|nr:hypothetical protein OH77DRAFT_724802 [Trametes cingulata]